MLSRLPLPAADSDVHGDCQWTQPKDADVHFVGLSEHWPRMRSVESASDTGVPIVSILDPDRCSNKRGLPALSPVSLREDNVCDSQSHEPQVSFGVHPYPVLPVSRASLADRISQRTCSGTVTAHDKAATIRCSVTTPNSLGYRRQHYLCPDWELTASDRCDVPGFRPACAWSVTASAAARAAVESPSHQALYVSGTSSVGPPEP